VLLGVQPAERVDVIALVRTPDESFNKAAVVFGVLAEEAAFLRATAEAKI
jgi:WASH complex subunit 7